MLHPIPLHQLESLTSAVDELGGTVPGAITELMALRRAADDEAWTKPTTLAERHAAGTLSVENVAEAIADDAIAQVRYDRARSTVNTFESYLGGILTPLIRGALGDELVASVQPIAEEHLAVIRRAAKAGITAQTTAEDLIDESASARKMWRDVETAAHSLNAIHAAVVMPLVVEIGALGDIRAPGGPGAFTHAMWNVGPFDTRGTRASHRWLRCHAGAALLVPSVARERLNDSALGSQEWRTEYWDIEQERRKRDGADMQAAQRAVDRAAASRRVP